MSLAPVNNRLLRSLGIIVILGIAALPSTAQSRAFDSAGNLLRKAVEDGLAPGAGFWLSEPGSGIQEAFFGRYHSDTRIPIDSASQWLAAATIMTLVDDQQISLDEPLLSYFPDTPDDKAALTLRLLLAHASSLPTFHPCLTDNDSTLDQCAQLILQSPLTNEAGKEAKLGHGSFQVAARIAEISSETSWEILFQEKLAKPLGMNSTSFGDTSNPWVGAGAFSTLGDYGRFLSELLAALDGRGKVLSEASASELLSKQSAEAQIVEESRQSPSAFALGSWLEPSSEVEGEVTFSNSSALGFTPWLETSRKTAGIILVLAQPPEAQKLVRNVRLGLASPPSDTTDSGTEEDPGTDSGTS